MSEVKNGLNNLNNLKPKDSQLLVRDGYMLGVGFVRLQYRKRKWWDGIVRVLSFGLWKPLTVAAKRISPAKFVCYPPKTTKRQTPPPGSQAGE